LASYNAGRLFGEWHGISRDAAENADTIAEVLKRSPVPDAEEWAIMDYEAPRAIADMLGENPSFATLASAAAIVETLESHFDDAETVDAVLGVMLDGLRAGDLADFDADEWLSDRCAGEGDSLADWCAAFLDDTGFFGDLPKGDERSATIERYFDFESYARDLQLGGDISTARAGGRLLVFWGH
jgi:antirestriction protein